ncbi:NAD(P)-binding protein [Penicillium taxi]|uniref:NAD(P)-binding protein n=1 Tax=Penicillium taxi TaxID=168475 RepID=UPI002544E4CD|nr:NAD(P)-binding protein [Penicillium taxi]KAJ5900145.1 NAD(P)-binding protein [Penicillium taxi]
MTKTEPHTELALPIGSLVLVTGANGYIASHVVDQLLSFGYNVRGTVRAPKPWLNDLFEQKFGSGRFETVIIENLSNEELFHEACFDVDGILHTAADMSLNPDASEYIPNAVGTTINLLKVANRTPSVKRFVLTSSSSATYLPHPNVEGLVIDHDTWNIDVVQAAWSEQTPSHIKPHIVYSAMKMETERMAWKWYQANRPGFVFNTVLPPINFGRILSPEIPGSTQAFVKGLLVGEGGIMSLFPPQWFVDVEDCARLHLVALLDPSVRDERIFAFAEPQNWNDVVAILKQLRPENTLIPNAPSVDVRDLTDVKPAKRAEELLKRFFGRSGWVTLEESLAAGIQGL